MWQWCSLSSLCWAACGRSCLYFGCLCVQVPLYLPDLGTQDCRNLSSTSPGRRNASGAIIYPMKLPLRAPPGHPEKRSLLYGISHGSRCPYRQSGTQVFKEQFSSQQAALDKINQKPCHYEYWFISVFHFTCNIRLLAWRKCSDLLTWKQITIIILPQMSANLILYLTQEWVFFRKDISNHPCTLQPLKIPWKTAMVKCLLSSQDKQSCVQFSVHFSPFVFTIIHCATTIYSF